MEGLMMFSLRSILGSALFVLCVAQFSFSATYTVTKTADTNDGTCDADCSLREAVAAANATTDNDTIVFDSTAFAGSQTITLAGTEIVIVNNGSLTISGTGSERLTIDGNNASRIISNNAGAATTISNMMFTRGNGAGAANTGRAGAIYNNGGILTLANLVIAGNTAANGGGTNHANTATTTYINCVIANNSATGAGGGLQNFSGSTLTMINSSMIGNVSGSTLTGGGAMQANGALQIMNTTFSGNRANGGDGGALYYNGQGLTMNNVTISGNTATGGGSGGLHKSTSTLNANIRNTIIAGNTGSASPDAFGAFNSQGNNLIGTVGTSTGWVGSDIQNQPALLSPLGFYGGTGMTFALLSGSPAINSGNNCVLDMSCGIANPAISLTADQRGASRTADPTVDIGAFEANTSFTAILPSALVNQAYSTILVPDATGFTYSQTGGTLPAGVTLNTTGGVVTLSGTPTATGVYNFAVTVSNGMNTAVVNYSLAVVPASASVTIGGRVFSGSASPRYGAVVTLTTSSTSISVWTNPFGRFQFENVPVGATVTISVSSKGRMYNPQTFVVVDAVNSLEFHPVP